MNTVTVNTSKKYNVYIGEGLMQNVGEQLSSLGQAGKAAIISDSNVWKLYGSTVETSLRAHGFTVFHFIFPAGEESKNTDTYLQILNFLAESHITRSDCIIALGGGVTGDLTGFAAATFLRGIPYIQIPTTLLAMVDSSVGGKTAVDLPAGKNLAGAFYQPSLVLCDTNALSTLPEDVFKDGCAEVIKYGILYDPDLFAHLDAFGVHFDCAKVVTRCVELKSNVVSSDEFDRGERQKLNLGHTLGHAIELRSHFTISHGKAVAIGTAMIARACEAKSICSSYTAMQIQKILKVFGLPTTTDLPSAEIYAAATSDKKRLGSKLNLIVPEEIGKCSILSCDINDLTSFIEAGL